MVNRVVELAEFMPVRAGTGDVVDWADVRQRYGVDFPDDYKEFIATYGACSIGEHLMVALPDSPNPPWRAPVAMPVLAEAAQGLVADFPCDFPLWPAPGGMIGWGATSSADLALWVTSEADPNKWPTVVWDRGSLEWNIYGMTMSELLYSVFVGHVETPFSDLRLSRSDDLFYTHWTEEVHLGG